MNADVQKIEDFDYKLTERILGGIFEGHQTTFKKRVDYSPTDMLLTADTRSYSVEIKSVFNSQWHDNGLLLQFYKLCRAKKDLEERECNDRLLFIYLCHDVGEYFIYDVDKINWEMTPKTMLKLRRSQLNPEKGDIDAPVMFLRKEDCIYHGDFFLTDTETETLEYLYKTRASN